MSADHLDSMPVPVGQAVTGRVAMNAPPAADIPRIRASVARLFEQAPEGKHVVLASVATTRGANLVVGVQTGEHVALEAFIGKAWGQPLEGGVQVVAFF